MKLAFKTTSRNQADARRGIGSDNRRVLAEVLAPLEEAAGRSPNLIARRGACFEVAGEEYEVPRYLFIGPKAGNDPIPVGLFAGIHGDEPEGVHGLISFINLLDRRPELAAGYVLFVYPICNPTGFEDRTRHSRRCKDLNRGFWVGSEEPEVQLLEAELVRHSFQGIISLHTDDTSDGFYGFASGPTLTQNLIEPALKAAEQFLPRNDRNVIDGLQARNGIIRRGYEGVLSAPPKVRPRPFEIILETPQAAPAYLKEAAFVAALQTVLTRNRELLAYAANL